VSNVATLSAQKAVEGLLFVSSSSRDALKQTAAAAVGVAFDHGGDAI
jgi:hypothetical protein